MASLTRVTIFSGGHRGTALAATTLAFAALIGWSTFAVADKATPQPASPANAKMAQRFESEIWPLLTRPKANCVGCHNQSNPSQLHFPADAASSYQLLLSENRFKAGDPSSLLARISATDAASRMPPSGMSPWTKEEQAVLSTFMADLAATQPQTPAAKPGVINEEPFPKALLTPYHGSTHQEVMGEDNTFLTYYQLQHKIKALFDDDWYRAGRDLFVENVSQFGGADFVHRYDETTRPTAAYLSAAGALAKDVAARAYLNKAGPFTGRPEIMPMPGKAQNAAVRAQINTLYYRLLFRYPSSTEMHDAIGMLQTIAHEQKSLDGQTDVLGFAVDVQDDNGMRTTKQLKIATMPSSYGVAGLFIDQSAPDLDTAVLPGAFTLRPGDSGQRMEISNRDTAGRVSFRSLILRGPLPEKTETVIGPDAPGVQADGAWKTYGDHAKDGYDDDNNNKGASRLDIPLTVSKAGKYEVQIGWRKSKQGAPIIPVTLFTHDISRLDLPPADAIPPKGEAHYIIDETVDTIKYLDLGTAFQFDSIGTSGVEISNAGTHRRVVADAVSLVPNTAPDGDPALIMKANDAEGHETWPIFKPNDTLYNTIGPDLRSDDNKHKGELKLLFAPRRSVPLDIFYRTRITYPGHVDNETQVPLIVHAFRSSPIVRVRAPAEAPIGATVTLDAASSYNVQHSTLRYTWRQIGGPRVVLSNPHAATTKCIIPRLDARQAAWEGLCRALIVHPDFLFTRPRSLLTTRDPATRKRLQLVKIAQDLVGRPPTPDEVAKLAGGASLKSMVDYYLASSEFDDFYFRRVRLYLESHGTPVQDEPARLWSYIMREDRPFTEILTANYTIAPDGTRQDRPAYCGHTGILTMKGFIEGKQGLPHFNYAAQVCEKFLGYVFEITPEVIKARGTLTAASTVDPKSLCYTCHQVLTPLAYQRTRWTDDAQYKPKDASGTQIDDSDRAAVPSYPFKGEGLEAFAMAAQHTERFDRAMIQTHFVWFFGREMRYDTDERGLYKKLWDATHHDHYNIKGLIRALVMSPEYLGKDAVTQTHTAVRPFPLARTRRS